MGERAVCGEFSRPSALAPLLNGQEQAVCRDDGNGAHRAPLQEGGGQRPPLQSFAAAARRGFWFCHSCERVGWRIQSINGERVGCEHCGSGRIMWCPPIPGAHRAPLQEQGGISTELLVVVAMLALVICVVTGLSIFVGSLAARIAVLEQERVEQRTEALPMPPRVQDWDGKWRYLPQMPAEAWR